MDSIRDVIVVGGGPAGLMAALCAARRGRSVTVLEAAPHVGAKFCYSAMGAAAVTNVAISPSRFHGPNARFVTDALNSLTGRKLRAFLDDLGVALQDARYYGLVTPTEGGSAVVSALVDALEQAGGVLALERRVLGVSRTAAGFDVAVAGAVFKARQVVLACGGPNLPQLGGADTGYGLAAALGHKIEPARPALVGLRVRESWPLQAAGLWMDCELSLQGGRRTVAQSEGSVLFTGSGLTGEAVFNLSRAVEPALARGEELSLRVNFHPGVDEADVAEWLRRALGERTRERAGKALDFVVPRKLGDVLLRQQGVKHNARVMQLDEKQRDGLLAGMTRHILHVTGTLGFKAAEGVTGGVHVREVDPRSFESRVTPGLYIVGQMLDVAGDWGGFEQHFAFASGFVAGGLA